MEHQKPFLQFQGEEWRKFHQSPPIDISESEIQKFAGTNELLTLKEVEEVYQPIAKLLNFYIQSAQNLYRDTADFLGTSEVKKVPYIIGMAGSVAVGKSTTARILQYLLRRENYKVDIVTTDGYIFPLKDLKAKNILHRKGFPESYNTRELLKFLSALKAGAGNLKVPVYGHKIYDILPDEYLTVDSPDVVILEGLNVFQVVKHKSESFKGPFVSDYFDFGIYVDAPVPFIETWFYDRFFTYLSDAKDDPTRYLHQYRNHALEDMKIMSADIWRDINLKNLLENILPFKGRADMILEKGEDHAVKNIYLRKI